MSAAAAASAAPHLLTSAICQCETLADAQQVFAEMSAAFNNVHVAAMVSRLPKVCACVCVSTQGNKGGNGASDTGFLQGKLMWGVAQQ